MAKFKTKTRQASEVLKELREQLTGEYLVEIELNDDMSIKKLGWLKERKVIKLYAAGKKKGQVKSTKTLERDFLKVTPEMEKRAAQAFIKSLKKAKLAEPEKAIAIVLHEVGESILEHVARRFQGGKRDIKLTPLAKSTIKRKGHSRVGIDSGDLYRDILNGTVKIKRIK